MKLEGGYLQEEVSATAVDFLKKRLYSVMGEKRTSQMNKQLFQTMYL